MEIKIREIQAKSILNPSKLGCDYAINPYNGCALGCAYCYAIFMSRMGHQDENWGEWVDVKINAPDLLIRELQHKKPGSIFFSSVTDPYQGLETKYQLTRKCLQILADARYPAPISILTKSPLETKAPVHSARIRALKELHQAGIKTYAFVGPLLPHLAEKPKELERLFKTLKEVGVGDIWVEHINLSPYIKKRLYLFILKNLPNQLPKFKMAENPKYQERLARLVNQLLSKIKFRSQRVIKHD